MPLYYRPHPNLQTIAETVETNDPAPAGFEETTPEAFEAWKAAELAAGWTPAPPPPAPPPAPAVPRSVTPYQIRAALNEAGLRAAVEAAVAAAPQNVKDAWEFTLSFERYNPTLVSMAAALGLSSDRLDELFIKAGKLAP